MFEGSIADHLLGGDSYSQPMVLAQKPFVVPFASYSERTYGVDGESYTVFMTDEEYHADRTAYNFSRLKVLLKSAMAFHYSETTRLKGSSDSPARVLGKAVHLAVLQPELISTEIAVWDGERRQGYKWDRFKEANADRLILNKEQLGTVASMAASVKAFQDLDLEYMFREGESEKVLFWKDKKTGIWLKVKLDSHFNNEVITDVKTVGEAKLSSFLRNQALPLHWDMQAVMYCTAADTFTGNENKFSYVTIEDEEPHHVVVHDVKRGGGYWRNGEKKFRYCVDLLKYCLELDTWPGYNVGISELSDIPAHMEWVTPL